MAKSKMLKWKARQPKGAIMKPSTFKEIERKAEREGYSDPKVIAGAAYQQTLKAKFKKAKKK